MERLLRRRKCLRSQLDAIAQEAEGILREPQLSSSQVSVAIDRINAIYGQLAKIYESILNETPGDLLETEITDATNYGDKIVTLTSKLRFAIQNDRRLRLMQPHRWTPRVFDYVHRNCIRTRWSKRLQHLSRRYGFYVSPVKEDTERKWAKAVKTQVRLSETDTWRRNMEQKATLRTYREHKQEICVEPLFDNSVASSLLFEARAGALRTLAYRQRFDDSVDSAMCRVFLPPWCRVCGAAEESIEHLVVNCGGLTTAPTDGTTLQQALGFSP
ncbi:hypothetical protein MTO96_011252, partial [Rhipicephalus appendiculatus]